MKKLLLSSALIAALSFGSVALAEVPSSNSQPLGLTSAVPSSADTYGCHHRYWDDDDHWEHDDDWDDDDRWDDDDDDWDDDDRWEHRHRGHRGSDCPYRR